MSKLCTRQHFIEYLSYNFTERQCLLSRCLWFRHHPDYGFDGYISSVNELGEIEPRLVEVQVKSSEKLGRTSSGENLVFDLSLNDLETWLSSTRFTILVLYDAQLDLGYYLEVAKYFKENRTALQNVNKFVRVYIPVSNRFDPEAVQTLRTIKNEKNE